MLGLVMLLIAGGERTIVHAQTLAPPTVTPINTGHSNDVTVNMSSFQSGATVRYTQDGTEPTASSTLYSGPFIISTSTTIKAKAFHPNFIASATTTRAYTLRVCNVFVLPFNVEPPELRTEPVTLTAYCGTTGASIYYTTDGSIPTQSSTLYTGPLTVSTRTTLRFRAFRAGLEPESFSIGFAEYYFNYGTLDAPAVEPATGTYSDVVTVNMGSAQPGAQIRYTTDGNDPTDQSTLYTTPFDVSASVTVKAKAFHVDWTPSGVTARSYEIGVATPTISPATGTYTTAQSVTLSTATPGATIRYSLDGSPPTESHPAYSVPITVDTATTVTARAFKAGYSPSAAAGALYQFNYGTLADPVISPPGGSYTGTQTVTVSAGAGEVVHYTVDGSTPTLASPTYAAPLSIAESATLNVRAFRTDWTPSAVVSATYDITADTEAPTIMAILRPTPNANGWNRSPVTVSYSCDDDVAVVTCPPDVTVSTPGANQVVTGTVTDSSGLTASASVTLNLDTTKPVAAITSPAAGLEVATETIEVTGTVSDDLSGVASASCGGQPATITAGAVTCTMPLAKGKNTIVLEVSDLAGNSASSTVSVFRLAAATSIRIVPSTFSMLVAEPRILQVVDDFGRTVENATFTVSDTDVAEMDEEIPMRVNALAPGTATITATSGMLTAEATVTVTTVAGPNTTVWSVPGQIYAGYLGWVVYTQNGGPDDPDLYLIERADGFTTLRGMKGDGRQLSINSVAGGEAIHAEGDAHGGVVLLLRQQTGEHSIDSIARVGPEGVWTRRSTGTISNVVVDSDDTIYALESEEHNQQGTGQFVVSSGTTEVLKLNLLDGGTSQIGLPSYVTRRTNWDNCQYVFTHHSATVSGMTIDTENNVRILLTHGVEWGDPAQFAACGYGSGTTALTLSQLTVGPSGTSMQTLKQSTMQSLFDEPFWPASIVATETGALAYDSEGGWVNGEWVGPPTTAIRLTNGGGSQITMAVPVTSSLAIGRNNVAYVSAENGIAAFDAATGMLVWQSAAHGSILNVLDNGGVALFQEGETSGGFITLLDGVGLVTSTQAVPVAPYHYWGAGEWHGISGEYFTAVQAQTVRLADSSGPRVPKMTHFYPIDLDPQVTAQQARARIENAVPANRMTHEFYLKNGYVTAQNFLNEIKDATNDAIGFIGHSVLDGNNEAYGLFLASSYPGPGFEETILRAPDPPDLFPNGPGVATLKRRLETQVKIAFIGSCGLGDNFKGLWDITPTTTGRVLISSPTVQVRLNVANVAWEQMIKALDDGCTVSEAVTKGNTLIHSMQTNGVFQPHPAPGTFVEQWEATGDGTIRLRTVRKGMCAQ